MKRAEPSAKLPAISVARNVVFGSAILVSDFASKSSLTGATVHRG